MAENPTVHNNFFISSMKCIIYVGQDVNNLSELLHGYIFSSASVKCDHGFYTNPLKKNVNHMINLSVK